MVRRRDEDELVALLDSMFDEENDDTDVEDEVEVYDEYTEEEIKVMSKADLAALIEDEGLDIDLDIEETPVDAIREAVLNEYFEYEGLDPVEEEAEEEEFEEDTEELEDISEMLFEEMDMEEVVPDIEEITPSVVKVVSQEDKRELDGEYFVGDDGIGGEELDEVVAIEDVIQDIPAKVGTKRYHAIFTMMEEPRTLTAHRNRCAETHAGAKINGNANYGSTCDKNLLKLLREKLDAVIQYDADDGSMFQVVGFRKKDYKG